jgi:hypothetical protein
MQEKVGGLMLMMLSLDGGYLELHREGTRIGQRNIRMRGMIL